MKAPILFRFIVAIAFVSTAVFSISAQTAKERAELLQKRLEIEAKAAARGGRSLKSLLPKESFVSIEGGFSIKLPSEIGGEHTISQPGGLNIGKLFAWVFDEAGIVVGYTQFGDPKVLLETDQQAHDYLAGVRNGLLRARDAKLLTDKRIIVAGHRGYEFSFSLPDGGRGIARAFLVGKRGYTLLARLAEGPEAEKLALKAFDSFQLLPNPS